MMTAHQYLTAPRPEASNKADLYNFLLRLLHLNQLSNMHFLKLERPRDRQLHLNVFQLLLTCLIVPSQNRRLCLLSKQWLPIRTIQNSTGPVYQQLRYRRSPYQIYLPAPSLLFLQALPQINQVTHNTLPLNVVVHTHAPRLHLNEGKENATLNPESAMSAPHLNQSHQHPKMRGTARQATHHLTKNHE